MELASTTRWCGACRTRGGVRHRRPGQNNLGGTAAGVWMYLNNGQRYVHGHFPEGEPAFF